MTAPINPRYFAALAKAGVKTRAKPRQLERVLQTQIVTALRKAFPETFFAAIPNGGSRNKIEASLMKQAGGVAGLPDLMVIPAGSGVGFIEIKVKIIPSAISEAQRDFMRTCDAHGIPWAVVDSIESAIDAVMVMKGLRAKPDRCDYCERTYEQSLTCGKGGCPMGSDQ